MQGTLNIARHLVNLLRSQLCFLSFLSSVSSLSLPSSVSVLVSLDIAVTIVTILYHNYTIILHCLQLGRIATKFIVHANVLTQNRSLQASKRVPAGLIYFHCTLISIAICVLCLYKTILITKGKQIIVSNDMTQTQLYYLLMIYKSCYYNLPKSINIKEVFEIYCKYLEYQVDFPTLIL